MEVKMGRVSRDKSIGLRVGDTIIHANDEFTIIDIRREEKSGGLSLYIAAVDADKANEMQQEEIKHQQIGNSFTELIRKFTEKGLGGMGG
jgi:hypothetical protein